MLRVIQQDSSAAAKQYYSHSDYLSEQQELAGVWGGKVAEQLGLNGIVGKEQFDRLCDNLHPVTGKRLTVRTRSDRTVGYDFSFSAPKSLSAMYALTGDDRLLEAFSRAIDVVMERYVEPEMMTRVRKNGKDEYRLTAAMLYSKFIHKTSRPVDGIPDMQVHGHVFAQNATIDPVENRIKAAFFGHLKRDAPYFQAVFRQVLADLVQDLGYGIIRKRDDFEIAGVPASVIRKFSRRSQVVEDRAKEKGIFSDRLKSELAEETRERKNHDLTWPQLVEHWKGQLTDEEREAIEEVARRRVVHVRQTGGEKLAVDHALDHCYTREPSVPVRMLLTEALKRGLGSVTIDGVQRELESRKLIVAEVKGRQWATVPRMKEAEDKIVAFGRDGRGKLRPLSTEEWACRREWLNAGQRAAVRHVLNVSREVVTLVRGPAGTGKTEMEGELREALEAGRVPTVAVAQSTTAVDELRERAGFKEAATIAHFLRNKQMQASIQGGLLLLDEGSLVGTKDMLALFDIVREQGGRIAIVGDIKQHRSVSAGEPMRLLQERSGVPVCELPEIVRQTHGDYRKVAAWLARGETEEAFAELDKLGWIREIDHAGRYFMLAQGYLSTILEKKKNGDHKTSLCVSPSHAEGARVTAFIRNALKQDEDKGRKLGKEQMLSTWVPARLTDPQKADPTEYDPGTMLQWHTPAPGHRSGSRQVMAAGDKPPLEFADRFEVYRPSQLPVAVHDRLRITANGRTMDGKHALKNGMLLSVRGFTKEGDLVVDHGWVIAKDFGHIAHGYCVTSFAAEGRTVEKVYVGMSSDSLGATNQRSFYVPVTRGREQAVIFTDSKERLLAAVRKPDQPLAAVELAELAKRKPPLRQRLKKHLANLRRQATFGAVHGRDRPGPEPAPQRENLHVL